MPPVNQTHSITPIPAQSSAAWFNPGRSEDGHLASVLAVIVQPKNNCLDCSQFPVQPTRSWICGPHTHTHTHTHASITSANAALSLASGLVLPDGSQPVQHPAASPAWLRSSMASPCLSVGMLLERTDQVLARIAHPHAPGFNQCIDRIDPVSDQRVADLRLHLMPCLLEDA